KELGSNDVEKQERARVYLEALGEVALEPLRAAETQSDDFQIRWRAGRLLKGLQDRLLLEQAQAIMRSNLTPAEKGERLTQLIRPGMDVGKVDRALGLADVVVFHSSSTIAFYGRCGLCIESHRSQVTSVTRVGDKNPAR